MSGLRAACGACLASTVDTIEGQGGRGKLFRGLGRLFRGPGKVVSGRFAQNRSWRALSERTEESSAAFLRETGRG